MVQYKQGTLITEGKTKKVFRALDEVNDARACVAAGTPDAPRLDDLAIVRSNSDITAGDGARHDVMSGKDAIANATTVHTFRLLRDCHLSVAFVDALDETAFLARECKMVPLEVVVRREAHGSHCRRFPHLMKGTRLPRLLVQFYLKTTGRKWGELELPCDDPLIAFDLELPSSNHYSVNLFRPDEVGYGSNSFLRGNGNPLPTFVRDDVALMAKMAADAFLVLEKAWQAHRMRMVDFKVEFGRTTSGQLVIADVIDADSFRVVAPGGEYLDKQAYRDGGTVEEVFKNYLHIRDMTSTFCVPQETAVLWRASERDDVSAFKKAWAPFDVFPFALLEHQSSAHKETLRVLGELKEVEQRFPNAVLLTFVGRSNGLGPVLAGNSSLPVVSVCASAKEFSEDVWSSLRMPSSLPHATILDPANAVLFAMRIFARTNPLAALLLARQRGDYYEVESLPQ